MLQAETFKFTEYQFVRQIYGEVTSTYISEDFSNIVFMMSFLRFSVIN